MDQALSEFRESAAVFGRVGRATPATDPAPFSMAETTIRLRPRAEWPQLPRTRWYSRWTPAPLKRVLGLVWPEGTSETTAELVEKLDHATPLPRRTSPCAAPPPARTDLMSTGAVRSTVG